MKYDVIIPAYNPGSYLRCCLESCLPQIGDFRILLIDDGGDEPLDGVVEEFRKKGLHIQLLRHPKNLGVAAARNTGLKHSDAPVIAFLDADDEMEPKRMERTLDALRSPSSPLMVCGNYRWGFKDKRGPLAFTTPPEISLATLLIHYPIHMSTVTLQRSLIDQVGLFDEEFVVAEDYEMWARILTAFPDGIAYLHEELGTYNWCVTEASLSQKYRHSELDRALCERIRVRYSIL